MTLRRTAAAACALLLTCAGASSAEKGKWEFGLGPGYSFPMALTGDYMRRSFNIQTFALYQLHEWLQAGMELGYSTGHNLGGKITAVDWDNPPDGRLDNVTFESTAKYYMVNFTPVLKVGKWVEFDEWLYKPYIAFGMGFYHSFYKDGLDSITGYTTKPAAISQRHVQPNTSAAYNYGINIGAGIDQQVFDFLIVGFDFRFHHVFNAGDYDRNGTKDDDFDFLIPALRIAYVF